MNASKTRFLILGISVLGLGIVSGTFLWLRFAPRPGFRISDARTLEGLSRHGLVPPFSLLERSGNTVTPATLRGKVWIADFIYTTCADTCPLQTKTMAKLQEEWRQQPQVMFVSFSVDPVNDTPDVLARYADQYQADRARWLFLTGAEQEIASLVQQGFRLSATPLIEGGRQERVILHSPRFVLVDKNGEIRGYYDSREDDALRRLKADVATLLKG